MHLPLRKKRTMQPYYPKVTLKLNPDQLKPDQLKPETGPHEKSCTPEEYWGVEDETENESEPGESESDFDSDDSDSLPDLNRLGRL